MNYKQRLATLQAEMRDRDIAAIYLPRGANLYYLTGIRRQLEHGTDHNAYGDWLCGGYIGQTGGVHLVAPRMGGEFWLNEASGKPWIEDVRQVMEPEDPVAVLREQLDRLALRNGKVSMAVDERAWAQFVIAVKEYNHQIKVLNANDLIMPMRMIKTPDELAAMQQASDLTDQVWHNVIPQLVSGVTEFEIASEIDYQFGLLGAEYTSFATHVFFISPAPDADQGTTQSGHRPLIHGDSVMFDFGGLVDGYASDFGRSAFCGEPSAEYLRAHDAVIQAQEEAMAAMVADQCTAAQANAIARAVIAAAGFDDGFWHRLGHAIGVTVHEPPFMDGVDQTVMQENMVFTVEPSIIYWNRFGNRIEDMVVVTSAGGKPMSKIDRRLYLVE